MSTITSMIAYSGIMPGEQEEQTIISTVGEPDVLLITIEKKHDNQRRSESRNSILVPRGRSRSRSRGRRSRSRSRGHSRSPEYTKSQSTTRGNEERNILRDYEGKLIADSNDSVAEKRKNSNRSQSRSQERSRSRSRGRRSGSKRSRSRSREHSRDRSRGQSRDKNLRSPEQTEPTANIEEARSPVSVSRSTDKLIADGNHSEAEKLKNCNGRSQSRSQERGRSRSRSRGQRSRGRKSRSRSRGHSRGHSRGYSREKYPRSQKQSKPRQTACIDEVQSMSPETDSEGKLMVDNNTKYCGRRSRSRHSRSRSRRRSRSRSRGRRTRSRSRGRRSRSRSRGKRSRSRSRGHSRGHSRDRSRGHSRASV